VLAELDCRGIEIVRVVVGNSMTVTSESSTDYPNADLRYLTADAAMCGRSTMRNWPIFAKSRKSVLRSRESDGRLTPPFK
jgi:hypothetical protein